MMPFIFCAPCDRPIEKIRNGTRIEYGSSTKPSSCISPSSHTTPSSELRISSNVLRQQRVCRPMMTAAIAAAAREEQHHHRQALDQVAGELGEADRVDADRAACSSCLRTPVERMRA